MFRFLAVLILLTGLCSQAHVEPTVGAEKTLLVCGELQQEDIQRIRIDDRDSTVFLVLTHRDGEVEFVIHGFTEVENINVTLPPWMGNDRNFRYALGMWLISNCGPTKCEDTRISCNKPL